MDNFLQIDHGKVNSYYPIKFNYSNETEFNELIDKLEKSDLVISEQSMDESGVVLDLKEKFIEVNNSIAATYTKNPKCTLDPTDILKDINGWCVVK